MKIKSILLTMASATLLCSCFGANSPGENNESEPKTGDELIQKGVESTRKVLNYFYNEESSQEVSKTYKRAITNDNDIYTSKYLLQEYDSTTISTISVPLTFMKLFEGVMSDDHYTYNGKPTHLTFGLSEGDGNRSIVNIEDVNDSFVLNMQFEDIDAYLYLNVKLNESALSSFDLCALNLGGSSSGTIFHSVAHFEKGNLYYYTISQKDNDIWMNGLEFDNEAKEVANYLYSKIKDKRQSYVNIINGGTDTISFVFSDAFNKADEWQHKYLEYAGAGNLPQSDCNEVTEEDFIKGLSFNKGNEFRYMFRTMTLSVAGSESEIEIQKQGDVVKVTEPEKEYDPDGVFIGLHDKYTYYSKENGIVYKYFTNENLPDGSPLYEKEVSSYSRLEDISICDLTSYKFEDFIYEGGQYKTDKSIVINGTSYQGFSLFFTDAKLTELQIDNKNNPDFVGVVVVLPIEEDIVLPQTADPSKFVSKEVLQAALDQYSTIGSFDVSKINDSENVVRIFADDFKIRLQGPAFVSDADHAYVAINPFEGMQSVIFFADTDDELIRSEYRECEIVGYLETYSFYLAYFPRGSFSYTNADSYTYNNEKQCYVCNEIEVYFEDGELAKIINVEQNLVLRNFDVVDSYPGYVEFVKPKPHTKDEFENLLTYPEHFNLNIDCSEEESFIQIAFDGVSVRVGQGNKSTFDNYFYTYENADLIQYYIDNFNWAKRIDDTHTSLEEIAKLFDLSLFDYDSLIEDNGVYQTPNGSYDLFGVSCEYLTVFFKDNNYIEIFGYNSKDESIFSCSIYPSEEVIMLPVIEEEEHHEEVPETIDYAALVNNMSYENIAVNLTKLANDDSSFGYVNIFKYENVINWISNLESYYLRDEEGQLFKYEFFNDGYKRTDSGFPSLMNEIVKNYNISSITYDEKCYDEVFKSFTFTDEIMILGDTIEGGTISFIIQDGELKNLLVEASTDLYQYSLQISIGSVAEIEWPFSSLPLYE